MKKFVRYADGAKMYSMGLTKFQELAKEARACYKIGQLVLVNTEILDKYLEVYHIKVLMLPCFVLNLLTRTVARLLRLLSLVEAVSPPVSGRLSFTMACSLATRVPQ